MRLWTEAEVDEFAVLLDEVLEIIFTINRDGSDNDKHFAGFHGEIRL